MSLTTRMMLRRLGKKKMVLIVASIIIAWSAAMMVSGLLSAETLRNSASAYLDDSGMPDAFITLSEHRSAAEVGALLSSSGVDAYEMRLKTEGQMLDGGGNRSVVLIGMDDPTRQDINRLQLVEGRLFSSPTEGVVIAGAQDVASNVHLSVSGNPLNVSITGTVRSPEYLLNELLLGSLVPGAGGATIILMPLGTLQQVAGSGINDVTMVLSDGVSADQVMGRLGSLPVSSVTLRNDHPSSVFIEMGADKMAIMLPTISLVFALIGAASIMVTMYRLVLSDSRQIGMLMSLGIERRRIVLSYLVMGGAIMVIGGLGGLILGYVMTASISSLALSMMGSIPVRMPSDPAPFLIGLAVTAIIVMAAVLLPVGLVLRRSIRDALSYVPKTRVWAWKREGRSTFFSLGARGFLREPKRAVAVVAIVGLTVGAAGSWLVLLDSSVSYIDEQASANRWDVQLSFNAPMDRTAAVTDFSTEVVSQAIPYVALSGQCSRAGESSGASVIASHDIDKIKAMDIRSGSPDFSGAVITNKLADALHAAPGDSILLTVGGKVVDLKVTAVVNEALSSTLYTSDDEVMGILGADKCQGLYVLTDSPDQAGDYAAWAGSDPAVGAVILKDDISASFRDQYGSAVSLFYAFLVLNLLIAFAVATSAVIITASEKEMDFATMATLGVPTRTIIGSITVEVGLLAIASALFAVPSSYLLAQVFAAMLEEAVFYIPVEISWGAVAVTLIMGTLFVWLSMIWPVRQNCRLDLERTLRERLP